MLSPLFMPPCPRGVILISPPSPRPMSRRVLLGETSAGWFQTLKMYCAGELGHLYDRATTACMVSSCVAWMRSE